MISAASERRGSPASDRPRPSSPGAPPSSSRSAGPVLTPRARHPARPALPGAPRRLPRVHHGIGLCIVAPARDVTDHSITSGETSHRLRPGNRDRTACGRLRPHRAPTDDWSDSSAEWQPRVTSANKPYRERVSRAASKSTSITRCGSAYIGVWSTHFERMLAPIRAAMKRWVFGLIIRSSSASKNHDGFVFHAGTGDASSMH